MFALILAGAAAAEAPTTGTPELPDPALLVFLGETAGMSPELVAFMESREAKRAVKDVAKDAPSQESLAAQVNRPDGVPPDREQSRERWKRFRELTLAQQAAVRDAYREFLELPPERRAELSDRWQQMSPEERRRAIQRRQGSKPGTIDKRPCPPCRGLASGAFPWEDVPACRTPRSSAPMTG